MIEKEVSDALHVLLHCALKDKEYETQKEQFIFVYDYIFKLENNWNELKKFIEKELDRLARECSQIYEDSLGKTRLVNEDIYNEVKNMSNKVQELEQGKDE